MSKLSTIYKRSSNSILTNNTRILSPKDYSSITNALSNDLADIINNHNNNLLPLLNGVAKGSDDAISGLTINAFSTGIEGSTLFTYRAATSSDPSYLYSTVLSRPLTIKESLAELYTNLLNKINTIITDTIVTDTSDIEADIDSIKDFIGMGTNEDLPTYSDHNIVTYVADEDPLEEGIAKLDAALKALSDDFDDHIAEATVFPNNVILIGQNSTEPTYESAFVFDNINKRLGVGTASPTTTVDIRGLITHNSGIISYGGNSRGTAAIDLQTTRINATAVASGNYSTIVGGENNAAVGTHAVSGGKDTSATGNYSTGFGNGNLASGESSFVAGQQNNAGHNYSTAFGYRAKTNFYGSMVRANGRFAVNGDAQTTYVITRNSTSDATPTRTYLDGSTTRITTSDDTTYIVRVYVAARGTSTGDSAYYTIDALVKRGTGVGTIALVAVPTVTTLFEDLGAVAWSVTLSVDTGTGTIDTVVTGGLGASVGWIADWRITSITI